MSLKTQNHLYNNGEERILEMFAKPTNDETYFIERLAKAVIGLRIDDWEDYLVEKFLTDLKTFKNNIETIEQETKEDSDNFAYKIAFVDKTGKEIVKTFGKTKKTDKAKLLENDILASLGDFGNALTENEKRQVLIDILEGMCV